MEVCAGTYVSQQRIGAPETGSRPNSIAHQNLGSTIIYYASLSSNAVTSTSALAVQAFSSVGKPTE